MKSNFIKHNELQHEPTPKFQNITSKRHKVLKSPYFNNEILKFTTNRTSYVSDLYYKITLDNSPSQHGEQDDTKAPHINGSIIALFLQHL